MPPSLEPVPYFLSKVLLHEISHSRMIGVDSILKCEFRYKQRVCTRRPNDPAGSFGSTPQLTQFSILEANQRRTSRRKVPRRLRGSRTP
jgi:hypothetical protein